MKIIFSLVIISLTIIACNSKRKLSNQYNFNVQFEHTKQIYKLFSIVFLILFGCKNEKRQILQKEDQISMIAVKKKRDSLLIEGDDILVKNNPRKGKLIMKLNEGDRCIIVDTSKVDTIRGFEDYWYQIKYKDTIGWVFGSQTNIKSKKSKETFLFLEQMDIFVSALKNRNFKTLQRFIFVNEPIHCVLGSFNNDHLRTAITNDLKDLSEKHYDIMELLDTISRLSPIKSQIHYTNIDEKKHILHLNVKQGIYYQKLYDGNNYISSLENWQLENGMVTGGEDNYQQLSTESPRYVQREKEVRYRLIIALNKPFTDFEAYQFYFYFRKGKWYLSGIHHPFHN